MSEIFLVFFRWLRKHRSHTTVGWGEFEQRGEFGHAQYKLFRLKYHPNCNNGCIESRFIVYVLYEFFWTRMLYCYWITNPRPRSRYELPKWKVIFWWHELTSLTGAMPWVEFGHVGFKRERARWTEMWKWEISYVFLEYLGILPFASFLGFCLRICRICVESRIGA